MSRPTALRRDDVRRLAELQRLVLPDSAISMLGLRYTRSFYRYVEWSPLEMAFVERAENGLVISACVVSMDIGSLSRRLLLHTSLLFEAALRPRWLVSALRGRRDAARLVGAELLLLFTDASHRGRGCATRLVSRAEVAIVDRGFKEYAVRTFDTPDDPALKYYLRRGFKPSGTIAAHANSFRLLKKRLVP
jgi:GNAT superfamily N-acetyltransferase